MKKIDNRSIREKGLDEMTLEEQVSYWTGYLTLSIGRGQFRDSVCQMILAYLNKPSAEEGA